MNRYLILIPIALFVCVVSCDTPPGLSKAGNEWQLKSFEITPPFVQFSQTDGIKDTSVSVTLSVISLQENIQGIKPEYIASEISSGDIIASGFLDYIVPDLWTGQFIFQTKTIAFKDFNIYVFVRNGSIPLSNTVSGVLKVRGFPVGAPEVEWVGYPDTVQIPSLGSVNVDLKAKVSHSAGQDLIENVWVEMRVQNGNTLSGSPFQLFDDGNTGISGDIVSGDSVFTRRFIVDPSNQPAAYELGFFSLDKLGTSSDTIRRVMIFLQ